MIKTPLEPFVSTIEMQQKLFSLYAERWQQSGSALPTLF